MTALVEEILAQAVCISGPLTEQELHLLGLLAASAQTALVGNLRSGVAPEACRTSLIQAGAMMALAELWEIRQAGQAEQFTAGELTVKPRPVSAAAMSLRQQARQMMQPYLDSPVSFLGV